MVPRTESDEYVEIANLGDSPQNLAGWRLRDIADGGPSFEFPDWVLDPGGVIRVYTNEVHEKWGGFSFGERAAVWNNSEPDEAGLFDEEDNLISAKGYPPGCE